MNRSEFKELLKLVVKLAFAFGLFFIISSTMPEIENEQQFINMEKGRRDAD